MKEHDRYRFLLAASLDEVLVPNDERELSAHLRQCASCRKDSVSLRRDHYWLSTLSPIATSPAVRSTVARAARSGSTVRSGRDWMMAAAVVVFAVGAIGALYTTRTLSPGSGQGVSPENIGPSRAPTPTALPTQVRDEDFTGSGSGRIFELDSQSIVGRITASVRGRHGGASGSIDFRLAEPGESWRGSVHYADYWYDASGEWYVAFVEGCREGPVCEPFVLQLVDGRARADKMDEVSLTWSTREAFDFATDWRFWYRIDEGNLVVPNVPNVP